MCKEVRAEYPKIARSTLLSLCDAIWVASSQHIHSVVLQYYERTDTIVRQIKDILSADITSGDNQEKLEGFKRDASAYGECSYNCLALCPSELAMALHTVGTQSCISAS